MAEKITVYQCPACTGPLKFDGNIGKLKCEYCGSTYTTQEIEALYADKNKSAAAADAEAHKEGGSGRSGSNCCFCGSRRSFRGCSARRSFRLGERRGAHARL